MLEENKEMAKPEHYDKPHVEVEKDSQAHEILKQDIKRCFKRVEEIREECKNIVQCCASGKIEHEIEMQM